MHNNCKNKGSDYTSIPLGLGFEISESKTPAATKPGRRKISTLTASLDAQLTLIAYSPLYIHDLFYKLISTEPAPSTPVLSNGSRRCGSVALGAGPRVRGQPGADSRDRAGAECRAGVYSSQTGRCPSGLPGTVSGPVPFRNSNGGTTNWLISFAEQYMNKGRFFGGRSLLAGSVVTLRRSRPAICDAPARSLGSNRMVRSVYSNSNKKKERFVYQWPAC